MNFEELGIKLRELYDKISSQDYSVNESYDTVTKEFNELFLSTINASVIEKKYFSCSPLEVYKIHFTQEIETAKVESFDFYEDEYLTNEYLYQVRVLKLQRYNIHKFPYYLHLLDQLNYDLFNSIHKKRIQYLEELLYKNGIKVNVSVPTEEFESSKTTFIKHFNLMVENDILLQLKPTPEILPETDLSLSNAVQKIIYLNELGIIDLLRKEPCFATSVNNLAKVITAITGEKHNTIQPYLNVLINKTGQENNNPYKTESTVEKVKNHLLYLGVKPK
jgi:hypothetical protein